MSFKEIAPVYDRFNNLDAYDQWLDYTLNALSSQPEKVLDLACGTGWFCALLSPFVGHITAVDIDPDMLAMAKAAGDYTNVTYQVGDMLDLSAYDQDFDLVTCYADSLCFLDDFDQVGQALTQMYERLNPGAVLLFDVWTPYQVTAGFDGFSYFDSDERGAILWDSEVDPEAACVTHYLTVFDQTGPEGAYTRTDAQLVERAYPLEAYLQHFKSLGADDLTISVDFGANDYDPRIHAQADRWFFRVVKS